jgi:hypothetical protein
MLKNGTGSGNECERTNVMGISRQPSLVQIMKNLKQVENVEYFNYLGSMITSDTRRACEIKSGLPLQK